MVPGRESFIRLLLGGLDATEEIVDSVVVSNSELSLEVDPMIASAIQRPNMVILLKG